MTEIAAALARPCRLLILDEPTAALTPREAARLFAELRRRREAGTSVIYISHRLEELAQICDRVSVLRDGLVVATLPAARTSSDELIRPMVGRAIDDARPASRRAPSDGLALEVLGLSAGVARDVTFAARRGEILGLAGLMGAGRTETLRAIFGADDRAAGTVKVDGAPLPPRDPRVSVARGLGFVTEDRKAEGLLSSLSLAANVTIASWPRLRGRLGSLRVDEARAATTRWIEQLGIRTRGTEQAIEELSGGSQQKALIARWLEAGARVLLLDEPTRGIDPGARHDLYRLLWRLANEGRTLIVASSDQRELLLLCDRIVVLSRGRVSAILERDQASEEALTGAAFAGHLAGESAATAAPSPPTPTPRGALSSRGASA
jgi:ribose transport system ATP-binding protein